MKKFTQRSAGDALHNKRKHFQRNDSCFARDDCHGGKNEGSVALGLRTNIPLMRTIITLILLAAATVLASEDTALDEFDVTLRALDHFTPPLSESERVFTRQEKKNAAMKFLSHTKLSPRNPWCDLARSIRDDAIREEQDEAEAKRKAFVAVQAATPTPAPTASPVASQQTSNSSHDAIWDEIERLRKLEDKR